MKHKRRLKSGDVIQTSIVQYSVITNESEDGWIWARSHVSGKCKLVRVDCDYTMIKEARY